MSPPRRRRPPLIALVAVAITGAGCRGGSVCADAAGVLEECGVPSPVGPPLGVESCPADLERLARCVLDEPEAACAYLRAASSGDGASFATCLSGSAAPPMGPLSSDPEPGTLRVRIDATQLPDEPPAPSLWSFLVRVTNEGEPRTIHVGAAAFELETDRAHVLRALAAESMCPEIGLAQGGSTSCTLRFEQLRGESPARIQFQGEDARRTRASITPTEGTFTNCWDGVDNDGNGFVDCGDRLCCTIREQCPIDSYCGRRGPENEAPACADGIDNDLDGYVDCGDRSCCWLFHSSSISCEESTYCARS